MRSATTRDSRPDHGMEYGIVRPPPTRRRSRPITPPMRPPCASLSEEPKNVEWQLPSSAGLAAEPTGVRAVEIAFNSLPYPALRLSRWRSTSRWFPHISRQSREQHKLRIAQPA